MLDILNTTVTTKPPAASLAFLRHQRRLMSALAVFCDTVETNALRSILGPFNVMCWEAGVLGLDDDDLDALIDNRCQLPSGQFQIGDIFNPIPLPIAA
jgi:hypothetical protein